jgi:hypothetical protein
MDFDTLSIDTYDRVVSGNTPAHNAILGNNMWIIENIRFDPSVADKVVYAVTAPMKILRAPSTSPYGARCPYGGKGALRFHQSSHMRHDRIAQVLQVVATPDQFLLQISKSCRFDGGLSSRISSGSWTIPRPSNQYQTRFAMLRANQGFLGETSHSTTPGYADAESTDNLISP